MNKTTIIFCEGNHDVSFLTRLLHSYGYQSYNKKILDLKAPYVSSYEAQLKKIKLENRKTGFQAVSEKIPASILEKDEELIIFHNLNGDGGIVNRSSDIVNLYTKYNTPIFRETEKSEEISFKFLYFMDADDQGVEHRLDQMKSILEVEEVEHGVIKDHPSGKYLWGCYIFHDDKTTDKKGTLEDLLLQLMRPGNEGTFDASIAFLEKEALSPERTKEFDSYHSKYGNSSKYKHKKSIVAVASQLQFSGSNISIAIAKSDYIQMSDIENNSCCKNILNLFL